jgi:hypothetical protein
MPDMTTDHFSELSLHRSGCRIYFWSGATRTVVSVGSTDTVSMRMTFSTGNVWVDVDFKPRGMKEPVFLIFQNVWLWNR